MGWIEKANEVLRCAVDNKSFDTEKAFDALRHESGFKRSTVSRVIHELWKRGSLVKLGRGLYMFPETGAAVTEGALSLSSSVAITGTPVSLRMARELLLGKGVDFMFTGSSALRAYFHLLPRRLLHLTYVRRGSGEFVADLLDEAGLKCLLSPSREQVEAVLETSSDREIFIVREFATLQGSKEGFAETEKALVDLYLESTRKRISYPEEEVARTFHEVVRKESLNVTRLLMFAARRGIRDEIRAIIGYLEPETGFGTDCKREHARRFIRVLEDVSGR